MPALSSPVRPGILLLYHPTLMRCRGRGCVQDARRTLIQQILLEQVSHRRFHSTLTESSYFLSFRFLTCVNHPLPLCCII